MFIEPVNLFRKTCSNIKINLNSNVLFSKKENSIINSLRLFLLYKCIITFLNLSTKTLNLFEIEITNYKCVYCNIEADLMD